MKVKILISDRAKGSPSNPALEHALAKEPRLRRGGRIWRYAQIASSAPIQLNHKLNIDGLQTCL